jgi:hypothetical protein
MAGSITIVAAQEPPAWRRKERSMDPSDSDELELALLRRGVSHLTHEIECCRHCRRRPLIGERVYGYQSGAVLCELCRALERAAPTSARLVHGPEFGHTMRIIDRRPPAPPH